MSVYEAINMMKMKMQALKEKAGPFVTEPFTDEEIGTIVQVLDATVFMLGELDRKISKLEEGGGGQS